MRVNGSRASMGRVLPHKNALNAYAKGTSDNSSFPHGEFDDLKKNFRAVQEENFKLQAVITDVTEVNKRWQKYNNDRQMYVQRLLSTIQDQQEQMNKTVEDKVFPLKEREKSEVHKPSVEALALENCRLQEELSHLRHQLASVEQEHREHVEVLEFQVKAHRDDWEAERTEKQQAEKKVLELQKDLRALKLKLRDEKLHGCSQFRCCGSHAIEPEQCNIFMPGSQVNMCRKGRPKTYRTSVHLPSTSGHLLSRGTTLFFGDDLAVDGDVPKEVNTTEVMELDGGVTKPTCSVGEDLPLNCSEQLMDDIHESHSSVRNLKQNTVYDHKSSPESEEDSKLVLVPNRSAHSVNSIEGVGDRVSEVSCRQLERKLSAVDLSLKHEDHPSRSPSPPHPKMNCSLLHITPSDSGSSIDPKESPRPNGGTIGEGVAASGVTIGFNSGGLASVMAFSHTPIAKSSSLPMPEEIRNKDLAAKSGVKPLVSRWSLDSNWSITSIASPPISQNFASSAESLTEELRSSKFTPMGAVSNDPFNSATAAASSSRKIPSWKPKYFDEGIATQTREDVICPGCGQVFPPKLHLKFLDHFEKCQSNEKEHKSNSNAVKSRN